MIPDFSSFLASAERRARQVRSWRFTSILVSLVGLVCFGFVGGARLLGIGLAPSWGASLVLAGALLCAAIAWVVYRRPLSVPQLLLRLDEQLDLDERLSSLYELRGRGGSSIFRQRIEAGLRLGELRWKEALPYGHASAAAFLAGLLLLTGSLALSAWPLSSGEPLLDPVAAQTEQSEGSPPEEEAAIGSSDIEPDTETDLAESDLQQPEAPGTPDMEPDTDFNLRNVLADLQVRASGDAVLGESPNTDLDELANRQAEAARELSETLESIRQRIEEEGGGLSSEEQQQLREQMQSAGEQMQQTLQNLLDEADPDELRELLSALANGAPDGEEAQDGQESTLASIPDDPDNPYENPPQGESPQEGQAPSGPGGPEEGPEMSGSPGEESSEGEDGAQPIAPGSENETDGGEEGASGVFDPADQEEVGFVRETSQGRIGDQGDITEFITSGVPMELQTGDGSANVGASVRFDMIRSILEARGLPTEALDAVRDYFEAISEGGS